MCSRVAAAAAVPAMTIPPPTHKARPRLRAGPARPGAPARFLARAATRETSSASPGRAVSSSSKSQPMSCNARSASEAARHKSSRRLHERLDRARIAPYRRVGELGQGSGRGWLVRGHVGHSDRARLQTVMVSARRPLGKPSSVGTGWAHVRAGAVGSRQGGSHGDHHCPRSSGPRNGSIRPSVPIGPPRRPVGPAPSH